MLKSVRRQDKLDIHSKNYIEPRKMQLLSFLGIVGCNIKGYYAAMIQRQNLYSCAVVEVNRQDVPRGHLFKRIFVMYTI